MVKYKSQLVLASGSPRRINLMKDAGLSPVIIKPDVDETIELDLTPEQTVMSLAFRKCRRANAMLSETDGIGDDVLLITADTVVYADRIIGKPQSEQDAFDILSHLNGRKNTVYSGVCLRHSLSGRTVLFCEHTDVYFKRYTDRDIRACIATGEPMDKAGAYAIQGGFSKYVERTVGDMDTVIGFPLKKIFELTASWPDVLL